MSPVDMFSLALLSTGGLYAIMLAYFNGLVGTKRPESRILWNSEAIFWFLAAIFGVFVFFQVHGPLAGPQGPGIWYLNGTGILLVIYIYLIVKLARHVLPEQGFWTVAALSAIAILYVVATLVMAVTTPTFGIASYAAEIGTLLMLQTGILALMLVFNLLRSLWHAWGQWSADPHARERLTAGGIYAIGVGAVSNPDAVLSDLNLEPGAKAEAEQCALEPGASVIIDFGTRRIEDHGFKADLRILRDQPEQAVSVEVSNDKLNWLACFVDDEIATDWDVPYFDSPWRYVRLCNKGEQIVRIAEVYDLD